MRCLFFVAMENIVLAELNAWRMLVVIALTAGRWTIQNVLLQ
jgi:hypothetical protein